MELTRTNVSASVCSRRSSSIGRFNFHHQRHSSTAWKIDPFVQIQDINSQVAQFRDLLINIGQSRDGPELRERVRKLRRNCVEACKSASQLVLPQMRRCAPLMSNANNSYKLLATEESDKLYDALEATLIFFPYTKRNWSVQGLVIMWSLGCSGLRGAMESGIPADSPNLVLLFFVAQLFLRELYKCKKLVRIVPMDMSGYYASKSGPSNIGNVISQILLCKQITPDFNEEELCSIKKDSAEISALIVELQEFMPQSEADTERSVALQDAAIGSTKNNGSKRATRWEGRPATPSYFGDGFSFLCCTARPNYL